MCHLLGQEGYPVSRLRVDDRCSEHQPGAERATNQCVRACVGAGLPAMQATRCIRCHRGKPHTQMFAAGEVHKSPAIWSPHPGFSLNS